MKQHPFFDGIQWNELARKQIAPPIDVGAVRKAALANGTKGLSNGADGEDDLAASFACFDSEFTDQQISLSMIEETASTACASPVSPRSRSKLDAEGATGNGAVPQDEFENFDFSDRIISVTEQQLLDLQKEIENKLLKAML